MALSQYCPKKIMRVGCPRLLGQTGGLGGVVTLRGDVWVSEGWSIGEASVWTEKASRKRPKERRTLVGDMESIENG